MADLQETYGRAVEVFGRRFKEYNYDIACAGNSDPQLIAWGALSSKGFASVDLEVHWFNSGEVLVCTDDSWGCDEGLWAKPRFPDLDTAMAYWELTYER